MRWLTRLTTGAVILAVIAGVVLLIRAQLPSAGVDGSFRTYVRFRDGSRLAVGSPVVIAGVRVGVIEKLTIEDGFARVDMVLRDGLGLAGDSFATRRADSLFGDSYVEIIPGGSEPGSAPQPPLAPGEPIRHVVEGGSTDAALRGIASALPRIDNALATAHERLIAGRTWVTGPLDDKLRGAADWLGDGHVDRPLQAADEAMASFENRTTRGAAAVASAAPDVLGTLDRIDGAVAGARTRMAEVKTGLVDGLHNVRTGLDRIDPQIAQVSEVMAAVNEGRGDDWKGTLGRLINDGTFADDVEQLTEAGRDAVAGFDRFRSWLGMRVEYNLYAGDVRFYATGEIRAHTDKFYLVEIERGPLGGLAEDRLSEVAGNDAYLREQRIPDRTRFTAQFGKRLGVFSLRGGIKDSTFGAGVDALMLEGRLKLSADVYGSFEPVPRLKLAGALAVFRSLYVLGGVDDALNTPGYLTIVSGNPGAPKQFDHLRHGRDYFLGATLVLSDTDVATLLTVYGAALVSLL